MADQRLQRLRLKAMNLPMSPGVYIMHSKNGEIIYIGKAKQLKNRVSQYFGSPLHHTEKVRQMVSRVENFEYILCNSEYEALMLECALIKQHSPKYNILLKDDKGFHYIRVSAPPYPIIRSAMQKNDDGAEYIGPYYSYYSVRTAVDTAQRAFKLPRCSKQGKDMGKKNGRPCLNYHIGLCSAPCCSKIDRKSYEQSVRDAVKFITDGSAATIANLTVQMNQASENFDFENAARLRDSIKAIKDLNEKQQIIVKGMEDCDFIGFSFSNDKAAAEVFSFRESKLCGREQFIMDITDRDVVRSQFIIGYYSLEREIPAKIAIDDTFDDIDIVMQYLCEKSGKKISLRIPQRGDQKKMMNTVRQNAAEYLSEKTQRRGHATASLDQLADLLDLDKVPEYIESYDISHTSGSETVGGMVVFRNGLPYKNGYRKFKINDYTNDDYSSTRQVIERRFEEYTKQEDEYFSRLPDLVLLDGGIGQYNKVKDIIPAEVKFFAMVKNDRHKTRALVSDKGEIALPQTSAAYSLVYSIQEEVHRFAIGYHKQRRKKKMLGSSLSVIDGLGPVRIKNLMLHFGTVDSISKASLEQLCSVKTMTRPAAQKVYNYFHGEKDV